MVPEGKETLTRACLAAVARRAGVALVISFAEIDREYENGCVLNCVIDDQARCIRITAPEVRP